MSIFLIKGEINLKEEKRELTDEELEQVSGGWGYYTSPQAGEVLCLDKQEENCVRLKLGPKYDLARIGVDQNELKKIKGSNKDYTPFVVLCGENFDQNCTSFSKSMLERMLDGPCVNIN